MDHVPSYSMGRIDYPVEKFLNHVTFLLEIKAIDYKFLQLLENLCDKKVPKLKEVCTVHVEISYVMRNGDSAVDNSRGN